jgi:g-D-glutamyl-meso-diaminopimelate peptidase
MEALKMTFPYVVRKGDTLNRIARRFAVHIQSLYSVNSQLNPSDYIVPGQVIQIPVRTTNYYVIQADDTFFDLSKRFNISLEDLIAANSNADPRRLKIGQTIVLPISKGQHIVDTATDYGYQELLRDISLLQQYYPFIEVYDIGKSVLGKSIPVIKLGRGDREIHYNGSFHANEWITTSLLMKFTEDYAKAYLGSEALRGYDIRKIFEQTTLWIVPMVNPDGVELVLEGITPSHPYYQELLEWNNGSYNFSYWKANIRGVDLNDQFPAHWEVEKERRSPKGPSPRDYAGTAPLTEPEAHAMAKFTQQHAFRLTMAFHTQGEEIYWNYRDCEPSESKEMAERLARVSGYKAVRLTGSDAGYKDWFIQEFRKPGFTIEAGRGVNPLPITLFPEIYEANVKLMLLGLIV